MDSHRSHHQQYTKDPHIRASFRSSSSQQHWKSQTRLSGKCPDARSVDGTLRECKAGRPLRSASSWDYAVPNSDVTAGDDECAAFFVNFMAKSRAGRAKNLDRSSTTRRHTCTQEENGTKTRDTGQSRGWNTGETVFLTSETVIKAKSCRIEESTFMSTDHKAMFLETDMSNEGMKHTTQNEHQKTGNRHHSGEEKNKDQKLDWTIWRI